MSCMEWNGIEQKRRDQPGLLMESIYASELELIEDT